MTRPPVARQMVGQAPCRPRSPGPFAESSEPLSLGRRFEWPLPFSSSPQLAGHGQMWVIVGCCGYEPLNVSQSQRYLGWHDTSIQIVRCLFPPIRHVPPPTDQEEPWSNSSSSSLPSVINQPPSRRLEVSSHSKPSTHRANCSISLLLTFFAIN